jgi:manganese/zinc/iron transport system substrate-binding protein
MPRLTRRHLLQGALLAPAALTLGGCGLATQSSAPLAERAVRVVATTGMVADLAANVGGERVEARALMGAGVDPHLFKASERTLRTMERADLVLYNGLHLEGGLAYVLEQMGERQPVDAVARLIPPDRLLASADYEDAPDPHIWFDVQLWMLAATAVRDSLRELDPTHAATYEANAAAYSAQLAELDSWVHEEVSAIPAERRVLITAHDAFGYFGRAYGFEVLGIQGASTATEAGARDVQRLADLIAERRIPAIFVESSVPRRTVEALREAVQSRGFDVAIGGQLFSDAMGAAGTPEGTYLGMVRHNVDTIVAALAPTAVATPAA